jgi:hypothetical protein
MTLRALDCFSGLGGVSEGFLSQGFHVDGIEINREVAKEYYNILNAKYPGMVSVKVANLLNLKGKNYRDYDVIWGSPPCRNFSILAKSLGPSTWKEPPNVEQGLRLVRAFLKFVYDAKPKYWIMENVPGLSKYLHFVPCKANSVPITRSMKRSFYGNFPYFLFPMDSSKGKLSTKVNGKQSHMRINGKIPKFESWERARIPLPCSQAFAKACREVLEVQQKPLVLFNMSGENKTK